MAIVFKDTTPERKQIVKDAESGSPTTFYFRVTPALKRQVYLNSLASLGFEFGVFLDDVFRKALIGWDGLKDGDGNDVTYSELVRDMIVKETDTFTTEDVLDVFEFPKSKNVEKQESGAKKKNSTSKKP